MLGCQDCYLERNNLHSARSDEDAEIKKHHKSIYNRCTYPSVNGYNNYGALGIRLYPLWERDTQAFIDYVKALPSYAPGLTLDRYPDRQGNYEPGNVRWADNKTQALNKDATTRVIWNGTEMSFKACIDNYALLSYSQARALWNSGWSIEDIVNKTPSGTGPRVRHPKLRAAS